MACIASDPALDIEPDFASATFTGLRNCIIRNTQTTHDKAANELMAGWQQDHDICVAAWTLQVNEEAQLAAEAAQVKHEYLKQEQLLLDHSIVEKLLMKPNHQANGTFSFTKVEDFVALKSVVSFKPSRKAIQDHSLDWQQFDMAKNSFLLDINKLNWPEKHQHAITMFFITIISHPQCSEPFGERALLLYAVHVQRDWHDTLVLDNAFDISIFNPTLLKNLAKEVWNKAHFESLTEFQQAAVTQAPSHYNQT
ncbi:hypothetical protein EDB19DRAFT_1826241 [Suillus lakei]|nr:hypothetical protein EDB19DRAFT_1826241 [Suillus lakei]